MEIKLHSIKIREVVDSYVDSQEQGVKGYGGKLNIRPAFSVSLCIKKSNVMPLLKRLLRVFR